MGRPKLRVGVVAVIAVALAAVVIGGVSLLHTPDQKPFVDHIVKAPSLDVAVANVMPMLGDGLDDGVWLLAEYASTHELLFAGFEETTVARVLASSDRERGKKLCVEGEILTISRVDN